MTQTVPVEYIAETLLDEGADDPLGNSLSSVVKALMLLEVIASGHTKALGISDLAAASDLPKSTTHRLLKALQARGFIGRSGSKYTVGPRFFQLGEAAWSLEYEGFRRRSAPALDQLFARTGATVHLAVLDGRSVVYLEKITGRGGCAIPSRVGARIPANCTSLGKAILAFSPTEVVERFLETGLRRLTDRTITDPDLFRRHLNGIRENGIAFDRQEATPGVYCISAPVFSLGRPVAAVSIAGWSDRILSKEYANLARETSNRISRGIRLTEF
jgi:DNA-binding IclR family transcriptional regulator